MSSDSISYPAPWSARVRPRATSRAGLRQLLGRPERLLLLALSAFLNLWNLAVNGWANTYYS
ncbi:MAG: hypothetical protein JO372_16265, partial [Solirubrobacterales bacterium]|nr:hypothetical protein [Solirubrobacterales bacterium]